MGIFKSKKQDLIEQTKEITLSQNITSKDEEHKRLISIFH